MNRIYFLCIILVGYSLFFLLSFPLWYPFLLFSIGLMIGYCFHVIDRFFQVLFVPDLKVHRQHFLSFFKKGNILDGVLYLINKVPSASASFYFLLIYFPLALYLISSSGSVVGTGLMLGLGLSYSAHFILSYKKVSGVRMLYFKQLSSKVSDADVQKLMSAFVVLFLIVSFFVAL
ncbi:MAG: hypothetical protein ABI425_03010 [Patescibacteria group bacterium]